MDDVLDTSPDLTAEDIEAYLNGIEFPVTRDDMVHYAVMSRAKQPIVDALSNMEDGVYHDRKEIDYYLRRSLR